MKALAFFRNRFALAIAVIGIVYSVLMIPGAIAQIAETVNGNVNFVDSSPVFVHQITHIAAAASYLFPGLHFVVGAVVIEYLSRLLQSRQARPSSKAREE